MCVISIDHSPRLSKQTEATSLLNGTHAEKQILLLLKPFVSVECIECSQNNVCINQYSESNCRWVIDRIDLWRHW